MDLESRYQGEVGGVERAGEETLGGTLRKALQEGRPSARWALLPAFRITFLAFRAGRDAFASISIPKISPRCSSRIAAPARFALASPFARPASLGERPWWPSEESRFQERCPLQKDTFSVA